MLIKLIDSTEWNHSQVSNSSSVTSTTLRFSQNRHRAGKSSERPSTGVANVDDAALARWEVLDDVRDERDLDMKFDRDSEATKLDGLISFHRWNILADVGSTASSSSSNSWSTVGERIMRP